MPEEPKENQLAFAMDEADIPDTWKPVEQEPIRPGFAPQPTNALPGTDSPPPYFRAVLNPNMQNPAYFAGTAKITSQVPVTPLMPTAPSANPQTNAAIVSAIKENTAVAASAVTGMVFKGTWLSYATYLKSNVVIFNESAYVAITSSVGLQPYENSTNWTLLSENLVFNPTPASSVTFTGWSTFDTSAFNSGNSTTVSVGPLTPAAPNELALWAVGVAGLTIPTPSGWQNLGFVANGGLFVQLLASTAPVTETATISSGPWATSLSLFKYGGSLTAAITSVTVSGANVVTVTCNNSFLVGTHVVCSGLTGASFLNGVTLQIASVTSTQFTAAFTHAAYGPTADSGTATDNPYIQIKQGGSGAFTGPQATTFTNNVTAGSTLICCLHAVQAGGAFSAVSDNLGNTYKIVNANVAGSSISIAFAQNARAGATTITATFGSVTSANLFLVEVGGLTTTVYSYVPYDVVEFRGSMFVCLKETTEDAFTDPTSWGLMAQGTGYVDILSASYAPNLDDYGRLITNQTASNFAVTLPSPPPSNSWWIALQAAGTGTVVINPNGLTLDGSTSNFTLNQNQGVIIFTDGFLYYTLQGTGVKSVALTVPTGFTVTGSPITDAGTIAIGLSTETANFGWRGPASGAAAAPTFRLDVPVDNRAAIMMSKFML